ncbi:MAG: nuclear transport factor 2 family protein [Acidobacteria bacterium]|nr:nuclear transport factor 2 family protein [Acidobacteriota bacterium]
MDKATQLGNLRKAGDGRVKFQRDLSGVKVRAYGNVAIMTAVATFHRPDDGAGNVSYAVTTEIWVNDGGRWRLAHFQPTAGLRPPTAR